MPESELAKSIKKAVKSADKLVHDIKKDTADVVAALRELREMGRGEQDKS